jgi:hypothetical protein
MAAFGHTKGTQIDSALTTEFRGLKRLQCDRTGLRALPSQCAARSTMTIEGVKNVRRQPLGKLRERLVRRHAHLSTATAAHECSRHIELGIRVFMDQYVAAVNSRIQAAVKDYVQSLSPEQAIAWRQVQFRTDADRVVIARGSALPSLAERDISGRHVVIAFPVAPINQIAHIVLALVREEGGSVLVSGTHRPGLLADGFSRPSIVWGSDVVVISFGTQSGAMGKLARE